MNNENANIQLLKIADEIIGIKAMLVENVVYNQKIIKIKETSVNYLIGKLNYQNQEIPVLDVRIKFDLEATEIVEQTPLVIIQVSCKKNTETRNFALIVDKVMELVQLSSVDLISIPKVGVGLLKKTNCFYGMIYCLNKFILLLDLENILEKRC